MDNIPQISDSAQVLDSDNIRATAATECDTEPQSMPVKPVKRGRLRHGNQAIDPRLLPTISPRCGARGRRSGLPCRSPGIRRPDGTYGRCQFHGGQEHWA